MGNILTGIVFVFFLVLSSGIAHADQVIADDLQVQGSECVGLDCVNGDEFGFDTMRLKENNLRIHFDDTSTSAGFPSNDWRIIVNDSASGGASYFSVEDSTAAKTPFKIEAGARTNALYVDDGGRIGLGTSIPVLRLHIADGNTPGIRLDQDGTGGWGTYVWDVAGNEANFFIRDVTGGSKLPFRIQPSAPTNTLTLRSDGYVGIGTWSPDTKLHILETNPTTADRNMLRLENNGGSRIVFEDTATATTWKLTNVQDKFRITRDGTGVIEMELDSSGNLTIQGALSQGSDRNIKSNIEPVDPEAVLKKALEVEVSTWNYNSDPETVRHMGPMAQDFHAAYGLGDSDKTISSLDTSAVALASIQALNSKIEKMEARIAELENLLKAALDK